MKVTRLAALLFIVAVVAGCVTSAGTYPHGSDTRVDLSKGNYRVLKSNVRGTSTGFVLFGILPLARPSYANAMGDLRSEAQMEGKATALANVTRDESDIYLILFSLPKITVTADVIEFIKE